MGDEKCEVVGIGSTSAGECFDYHFYYTLYAIHTKVGAMHFLI